jgi:hypothetical protein
VELGELREQELQCTLHALIRVLLDPVAAHLHVAGGHAKEKSAAPRFLAQRFLGSLSEQRQFELAHRALHAEQQSIIGVTRIVDSALVDEDRADQSTELDQHVPVAAVAGETRGLDRQHRTDTAGADRPDQTIEPGSGDPATGAAKIVVDDFDRGPAELTGTLGERILSAPALVIVQQLIGHRLANVDVGAAGQVLSGDLGHRRPPRLRVPLRSRPSGPRSAPPVPVSWSATALRRAPLARTDAARCPRASRFGVVHDGSLPC